MKTRQYAYDLPLWYQPAPQPGEYLRHTSLIRRATTWYVIVDVRPVETRFPVNRWMLALRRYDLAADTYDRTRQVWPSRPYGDSNPRPTPEDE